MTEQGFTRRQLRAVTKLGLERLIADYCVSPDTRLRAVAALADLDGEPARTWRDVIWRSEVQPGLAVVVEDSTNILLELTEPGTSQVIARTAPLSWATVAEHLGQAHVAATVARDQAEDERRSGLAEVMAIRRVKDARQPGEDGPSRAQAVETLVAAGLPASSVARVLQRAYGHLSASFNVDWVGFELGTVSYDRELGTYHVRVPQRPKRALTRQQEHWHWLSTHPGQRPERDRPRTPEQDEDRAERPDCLTCGNTRRVETDESAPATEPCPDCSPGPDSRLHEGSL